MDRKQHEIENVDDLSALAWVHDELRRSIETAHKALRRFVRESETVTQSDVDAVDPTILRTARSNLHQGVGALELVGLSAAAQLLRASENAVTKLTTRTNRLTPAACDTIERSSFGLLDYLARMLAGKPVSPVALFPQYQAVQTMVGADRIHPADLWPHDWRWRDVAPTNMPARHADEAMQSLIESSTLSLMRQPGGPAALELSDHYSALANAVIADGRDRRLASLWQLGAGFFEALGHKLLTSDVFTKRVASRLMAQMRMSERGGVDGAPVAEVSERLAQDLLFFCSQAGQPRVEINAQRLAAVRQAWGVTNAIQVNYAATSLGRYDPTWIIQAKKRVAAAKESWSATAADEKHRLQNLVEQFHLVGESVSKLYASGEVLAAALHDAATLTVEHDGIPSPGLAMEVATAILYLDASLEDADFDHPSQANRVKRLAHRIVDVSRGGAPHALDPWMEELYRRVADRQTMGSVVQELRSSLAESEKAIDLYFRDPTKREALLPVPGQLQAMRGVMSVLGIEQASQTIVRMREDIEPLLAATLDANVAAERGIFDRMAGNLGALGFLIDMLSVQPQMAKSLFRFDAESGMLRSVVRRASAGRDSGFASLDGASAVEPNLVHQVEALALTAAHPEVSSDSVERDLQRLSHEAMVNDQPALAETIASVHSALQQAGTDEEKRAVRSELAQAMADFVQSTADASPLQPGLAPMPTALVPLPPLESPAAGQTGLEGDLEMRAIFLEEARDVIQSAGQALTALQKTPDDLTELTTVRRSFHTLKGSSRMVGLKDFGEAAWACEQLYNTRLADRAHADASLSGFTTEALVYLGDWVDAIEAQRSGGHNSDAVRVAADALRLNGQREILVLPAATRTQTAAPIAATPATSTRGAEAPFLLDSMDSSPSSLARADGNPRLVGSKASIPETFDASALDGLAGWSALPKPKVAATTPPSPVEADLRNLVIGNPLAHGAIEPTLKGSAPSLPTAKAAPGLESQPPVAGVDAVETNHGFADTEPALTAAEAAALEASAALPQVIETIALVPQPSPSVEAPAPSLAPRDSDNVKIIGHLKVPIPLFNIYLSEADEQSRRLEMELAEWQHELHRPVGESAEAMAHSIAGNSGTVGYADMANLARSLETGLRRVNERGYGGADEAQLFVDAAAEIRRLLHQFAAGLLKVPPPALLARLTTHEAKLAAGDDDVAAERQRQSNVRPTTVAASPVPAVVPPAAIAPPSTEGFASTKPRRPSAPVSRAAPLDDDDNSDDEDFDSVDAVDDELFPIFEEEGLELFPRLSAHMRDWVSNPSDATGANACLRSLHTIKGGARLAGAMRLGEMAHRLESSIEQLVARGSVTPQEVESLHGRVDGLGAKFETLRALVGQSNTFAEEQDGWADAHPATAASPTSVAKTPAPVAAPPAGLVRAPDGPPPSMDRLPEPPTKPRLPEATSTPLLGTAAAAPSLPMVTTADATTAVGLAQINWSRFPARSTDVARATSITNVAAAGAVRVKAALLDRLVNHAGEVSITRSRIDADVAQLKGAIVDLTDNLDRMRNQLREIELQAESQISSRLEAVKIEGQGFDPLEMDRFTRFQELTRMLAESVNDVATVHRGLQRTVQSTEDQLAAQARLTRELQDNLLRTRMVEFDSLSDRLYRVVRQAGKETGKQVRLDIVNGTIEVDRGVLERMGGSFEHLLRNCITHGIELPEARAAAGKDAAGTVTVTLHQEGNEVAVEIRDDGAGLDFKRIRERAQALNLIAADSKPTDAELAPLIFTAGFSTATEVTELSGRGIGMDVVRNEVNSLGGRVETNSVQGQGVAFKVVVPLTTAVTQVMMLRVGALSIAMPSTLVESVKRITEDERMRAHASGRLGDGADALPFFWFGALLQDSPRSTQPVDQTVPVVVVRSAQQRMAIHVDEVIGNQEVVVKNLGPQMSRLPGLSGITILPSGQVVLIYNPVALANLYGDALRAQALLPTTGHQSDAPPRLFMARAEPPPAPLVLVVDDSLTVRRVTQRMLLREGYRVSLAKDGLDGLEKLAEERPAVLLSDIEMPRMDGFDLVRNVRGDSRWRDLPVIMITSRIAEKHKEHAASLGVNHYLGKPYSEEELLKLISQYTHIEASNTVM